MMSPVWPVITIADKKILKVTGIAFNAWGWEGEATATQPKCITGTVTPLTTYCCILDKLSLIVITGSHFQLSFVHNEA